MGWVLCEVVVVVMMCLWIDVLDVVMFLFKMIVFNNDMNVILVWVDDVSVSFEEIV